MVDQSDLACLFRAFVHLQRFIRIHGHWLFAKHVLAVIERGEGYLHMRGRRSHDADQIHVITRNQFAPVVGHVTNFEFFGDLLSVHTMRARNRHDTPAGAGFEGGKLSRASKAHTDYSYTDDFVWCQANAPGVAELILVAAIK